MDLLSGAYVLGEEDRPQRGNVSPVKEVKQPKVLKSECDQLWTGDWVPWGWREWANIVIDRVVKENPLERTFEPRLE